MTQARCKPDTSRASLAGRANVLMVGQLPQALGLMHFSCFDVSTASTSLRPVRAVYHILHSLEVCDACAFAESFDLAVAFRREFEGGSLKMRGL